MKSVVKTFLLACIIGGSLQPPVQAQLILAESHFNNSTNGVEGWQGIDTGGTHETLLWVSDAASSGRWAQYRLP